MAPIRVTIDTARLARVLGAAIVVLAAGHLLYVGLEYGAHFTARGLLERLDLGEEQGAGTWFSSGLLAACALTAVALTRADVAERRGWLGLAGLLALLSLDEIASLHEATAEFFGEAQDRLPAALRYAWMIPALAVVAAIVAWQWRFIGRRPQRLRRRLVLAGAVYVGAAIGLEMVESWMFTAEGGEAYSFAYQLVVGAEETLEMGAAMVAWLALLGHVAGLAPAWTFRVQASSPGQHAADDAEAWAATAAPAPKKLAR